MNFHPYSEIFPLIEGPALDELAADIKSNGLREKIWTYEGKILDGRNRFVACQKAKIKQEYRKYEGDDPLAFVISLNVQRRHLTESQRAMAAARIVTMRQGERTDLAPIGARSLSQSEAAKSLKVGRRSVQRAHEVLDGGSKALQHAVENGDVSVSKAATVVSLPKSEQLAAAKKPSPQKEESPKTMEVTSAPDFDFTGYEPEDDEEYRRSIDNVMMADDKLNAMREELKQARREIQALKASRDHYQAESGQAVRLVKARDREIAKLKRQMEAAA